MLKSMENRMRTLTKAVCVATALLAVSASDAQQELNWFTIDGGGGKSTGSSQYAVHGTIGQPDASDGMSGGQYTVRGGFWFGAGGPPPRCEDCTGDVLPNGRIDLADLAQLLANMGLASGQICESGDVEPSAGDGDVDLADLATLLSNFGNDCP